MTVSREKIIRINLKAMFKLCLLISVVFNSTLLYAAWDKQTIKEMVAEEAGRQNFSIPLALAVAEVESNFDPYARSHVDARGVMQILPKTAEQDLGIRSASLYNPRVNIRAGVRFLTHLIKVYDGRVDIALSHYNGGSRVRLKDGSLKIIPATQGYVRKVLNKAKEYRSHHLAMLVNQNETFNTKQFTNITSLARREALDDFENGDPLMSYRSGKQSETNIQTQAVLKSEPGDTRESVINKLKNLVTYNQNRALSGGTNDKNSNKVKTNMREEINNGLVSQW